MTTYRFPSRLFFTAGFTIAMLLLTGCATSYQSDSWTGGFSEIQLGEDLYHVSFEGNRYTDTKRVRDFALLRAAEIALENGYDYFAIVDSNDATETDTITTPKETQVVTVVDAFGNVGQSLRQTGGETLVVTKPGAENRILLLNDPAKVDGEALDAEMVAFSVREQYDID